MSRNKTENRIVTVLILTALILLVSFDISGAIQVGKTVEFEGGSLGRVIFDGKKHSDAGYRCMECHNEYFMMKKGHAKIDYSDHAEDVSEA